MDALSETSAIDDSPAPTDISESYPETPDTENMRGLGKLVLTPAFSRIVSPLRKRSPGKGEIPRVGSAFSSRDRVRKRKRRHDDKDVSGFRFSYRQQDEWDESEGNASDDSTFQPNDQDSAAPVAEPSKKKKGWLGGFLSDIQKHPDAPRVLGYWITFFFNLAMVGLTLWLIWVLVASFRDDFWAARHELRAQVVDEMNKCLDDYRQNKCEPKEQRLPALNALCDEWAACMNQDADKHRRLSLGAKNIVEILNDIVEAMHWKTLVRAVPAICSLEPQLTLTQAALFAVLALFCFSGFNLVRSNPVGHVPYHPQPSQPVFQSHPQVMYSHVPQTPRARYRGLIPNDETPDTDASPAEQRALPPPSYFQTPSGRRSPSKGDRGRSPTKSRSPSKRY